MNPVTAYLSLKRMKSTRVLSVALAVLPMAFLWVLGTRSAPVLERAQQQRYEDIVRQCRALTERYTAAWIDQRYDDMYALLDQESQSVLGTSGLIRWAQERAQVRGRPLRLLRIRGPDVGISYALAVEMPKPYAERHDVQWSAAEKDREVGPRGYAFDSLMLVNEDGRWALRWGPVNRRLLRDIEKSPAHMAALWRSLGHPGRVASQLAKGIPSVPAVLSDSRDPWMMAASDYLNAWIDADYGTMYGLLCKETRVRESYEEFAEREEEKASFIRPLFVARIRGPEFVVNVVFERRGGSAYMAKLDVGPDALYESGDLLVLVKRGDLWRVRHQEAMMRWQSTVAKELHQPR